MSSEYGTSGICFADLLKYRIVVSANNYMNSVLYYLPPVFPLHRHTQAISCWVLFLTDGRHTLLAQGFW